ncbi:MAG: ABC transporter ATP-binding protein [Rickettsiales bacterium]
MAEQVLKSKRQRKEAKSETLIKLRNISKQYKHDEGYSVKNINLDIEIGDLFVLVGPSGCGKSTLLRMIAGFEKPTSGKIYLGDQDITDMPPHERPVNMMFQSYALFPHMNVWHNVAFGLKQEKLPEEEIDRRVREVLDLVNMYEFKNRKPDQLSGGQKQRVALARSLAKRPKVLLLDEPLGALDRKIREQTQVELIKIQCMLDITFIMVTHDQEEAMTLADCMAVMNDGKVLQVGTAEEVYENPNSRFVAEFVDSINLFSGKVVKKRNSRNLIGLKIKESEETIYFRTNQDYAEGSKLSLGLRPEEVEISLNPAPKNENQVKGKIIDYGFLGQKIVFHVELCNENNIHVSIPTSNKMKNPNFKMGKEVYVSWVYSDGVLLET